MQLSTRSRSIAFACSGLFVVAACGGNSSAPSANLAPPAQQILRVNTVVEPNSYDPTQETYAREGTVGHETFEALLKPKADLSDVQAAASQSYDVLADALAFTLHLQPNSTCSYDNRGT